MIYDEANVLNFTVCVTVFGEREEKVKAFSESLCRTWVDLHFGTVWTFPITRSVS